MDERLPTIFVPGLMCSARLYAAQIAELWRFGPIIVADHTRDDTMAGIAARILADAPPRFNLVALSAGGAISFAMWRQAPERIARLALLDSNARADDDAARARRDHHIGLAESGRYAEAVDLFFPMLVSRAHQNDAELRRVVRQMAEDVGPEAFVRQQKALRSRPDSRPDLPKIRCPTLVLIGDGDELTPLPLSQDMADGIPGARLVVVPDSGHLAPLEQPEAVNTALKDWLTW